MLPHPPLPRGPVTRGNPKVAKRTHVPVVEARPVAIITTPIRGLQICVESRSAASRPAILWLDRGAEPRQSISTLTFVNLINSERTIVPTLSRREANAVALAVDDSQRLPKAATASRAAHGAMIPASKVSSRWMESCGLRASRFRVLAGDFAARRRANLSAWVMLPILADSRILRMMPRL